MMVRVRSDLSVGLASRIASTGAVRAARWAGNAAATIDTTVPMSSAMNTVDASRGISPDSFIPIIPNPARSRETNPSPAAMPKAEPSTPTTAA